MHSISAALVPLASKGRRILRATPSATGPFYLLAVVIWGAWRLYFGTLGDYFGTSGAPWNHASSRMDTRGSGTGFSSILERYSDFILMVFWAPRLGLVSMSPFLSISESKFGRLGLLNPGFRTEVITKHDFLQTSFFMISGSIFAVFLRVKEQFF